MKRTRRNNKSEVKLAVPKRKRKQLIEAPVVNVPIVEAPRKIRRRAKVAKVKHVPKETTLADIKEKKKRTPWNPEFLRMIYHLTLLGAKEDQIAEALGVNRDAISVWKRTRTEVKKAIREGKAVADAKMAESFYHAGIGYSHPEDVLFPNRVKVYNDKGKVISETLKIKRVRKIKHYPPNVTAGAKWLKARHPELWDDRHGEVNANIVNINTINFNDYTDAELKLLTKMGFQQQGIEAPQVLDNKFDNYEFIDDGTEVTEE